MAHANTFVHSFTHLKDKPNPARAQAILERVASLVKPIMRKHNWHLPVLAEFFPKDASLLGMNTNRGKKIHLRLRPAFDEAAFLEEEDILGTMLHELTHNVHGPHDEKFYKFLGTLEDELYELRSSGYAGEGFHTPGVRLGGGTSLDLPPHLARKKALEEAEKRRKFTGVPKRLGGGMHGTAGMTLRELAAQAAERRVRDGKACASGEEAEVEVKRAEEQSVVVDVIDLTGDDEPVFAPPKPATAKPVRTERQRPPRPGPSSRPVVGVGSAAGARSTALREDGPRAGPSLAVADSSSRPVREPELFKSGAAEQWACQTCTLLNAPLALQCDACASLRPADHGAGDDAGWTCVFCGEGGTDHQWWTCKHCGAIRPFS